jgi:hypothetical protein
MQNLGFRFALFMLAALAPAAAAAAPKPFTGPGGGWAHTVLSSPSPTTSLVQETWKSGDQQISYFSNKDLVYETSLASVQENMATNDLKPSIDRDRTCDGRRAHEVEITLGPTVIHQVLVDDAPGVTKLNFIWPKNGSESPDAVKALAAYCGS